MTTSTRPVFGDLELIVMTTATYDRDLINALAERRDAIPEALESCDEAIEAQEKLIGEHEAKIDDCRAEIDSVRRSIERLHREESDLNARITALEANWPPMDPPYGASLVPCAPAPDPYGLPLLCNAPDYPYRADVVLESALGTSEMEDHL